MFDMRLQVSVNDGIPVRASLQAQGWLSVHLNLSSDDADSGPSQLRIQAIDKSNEPNSTISNWDLGALSIVDTAHIQILHDGEADPPTEVSRTSESPKNLFSNVDQARQLLSAISRCDKELMAVLEGSKAVEPEDEFKKITRAIGGILTDLDLNLIQPTLRRHPELLSEAQAKRLV
jgi:hypothetical protein